VLLDPYPKVACNGTEFEAAGEIRNAECCFAVGTDRHETKIRRIQRNVVKVDRSGHEKGRWYPRAPQVITERQGNDRHRHEGQQQRSQPELKA
jgi:hypothetical protein